MPLKPKYPLRERRRRCPKENWDFQHFKDVHHHLFQDVYNWAGRVRTVRISKSGNPFCFPEIIETQAAKLFDDLKQADYLRNLDTTAFCSTGAHFLAELNAVHAFREGNGRAQLTFFALLADYAGHPLDLDRLQPDEMLEAMIASFDGDEHKLATAIKSLID
jgi:cell filamentation protein, protein adenylyltransferase